MDKEHQHQQRVGIQHQPSSSHRTVHSVSQTSSEAIVNNASAKEAAEQQQRRNVSLLSAFRPSAHPSAHPSGTLTSPPPSPSLGSSTTEGCAVAGVGERSKKPSKIGLQHSRWHDLLDWGLTARQWASLHSAFLLAACALLAVATLFVFIPIHHKRVRSAARQAADEERHQQDDGDKAKEASVVTSQPPTVFAVPLLPSAVAVAKSSLTDDNNQVFFLSLWDAIVKGPNISRQQSLSLKRKHYYTRTVISWCYLLSTLAFLAVDLLEAWWLWTQVKPRGTTFIDDVDDAEEDSKNNERGRDTKKKKLGSKHDDKSAPSEATHLNKFYPFGHRRASNGYGGTVEFDDGEEDDEEMVDRKVGTNTEADDVFHIPHTVDSNGNIRDTRNTKKKAPPALSPVGATRSTSVISTRSGSASSKMMRRSNGDLFAMSTLSPHRASCLPYLSVVTTYGEGDDDYPLDDVLPISPIHPLSDFPRADRRIIHAMRVGCVLSILSAGADTICFAIYVPQIQFLLGLLPFGVGEFVGNFLLFWADRILLVGLVCTVASILGRVYRRLCLETERTRRVVRYPPFSFF